MPEKSHLLLAVMVLHDGTAGESMAQHVHGGTAGGAVGGSMAQHVQDTACVQHSQES